MHLTQDKWASNSIETADGTQANHHNEWVGQPNMNDRSISAKQYCMQEILSDIVDMQTF
jgi:hypothetical protein